MTLQTIALLIVVIGFSTLVAWVYSPANKERLNESARIAIEDEESVR